MAPHRASATPAKDAERVRVLLPLPLAGAYDYLAPPDLTLAPGDYVEVPLGTRQVVGVVWGPPVGDVDPQKLRPIARRFDVPPLPTVARRFVDWVAEYVMSAPGAVLRMTLGSHAGLDPPAPVTAFRRAAEGSADAVRVTPARRRVLDLVADGLARPLADIVREAGCGASVVHGLVASGALETVALPPAVPFSMPDKDHPRAVLTDDQRAAAEKLAEAVRADRYAGILLDGVTGAGKTEVYFEAVAEVLAAGRQVLVLLPEIALSAQWLDRFAARFGTRPATWHSGLTATRRRTTWRAVATGQARVVVGARSALFLPFAELGLIIVDEEHDAAFKQEDGVIYHARDMAVARAHLGDIPVVLVSATPSLETAVNAETGRYRRVALPARHGGASLPAISALDLRQDPPGRGRFLSPTLRQAVTDALAEGGQAMLFLNRRGYAPLTLCRSCGHRLQCPNCTAWLVEHRLAGRLLCHHCGYAARLPKACPACGVEDSLAACGPGVERIAEEVYALWPDARAALMTSDVIHGAADAAELVRSILAREVELVIGTQLVAKGHHFPALTLVGVVDADLGLAGGDLRAAERTYQVLHQVAGRAGRGAAQGRALIQTYQPDHPVIAALAAGDRDGFLAVEAAARRDRGLPPFGRLAAIVVSGPDRGAVDGVARALGQAAPRGDGLAVLGPAEAPLAILRGRHRRRLLVKAARRVSIQAAIADWLARVRVPSAVRVTVDIDPSSFL